jgi:hypothetical protein
LDDTLFELREFHGGRTVLGSGAIKPLITISCTSCGNSKMMNAIQLGLVDPTNPEGEKKEGGLRIFWFFFFHCKQFMVFKYNFV